MTAQTVNPQLAQQIMDRVSRIPIMKTLGIELLGFAPGECSIRVPYQKDYDGIFESFHGGLLMTAADTVACFAILTLTGAEQVLTTTDMNIRFLAPCIEDVRVVARVIKAGRSLCPVHVDLYGAQSGRHIAVAQVTYMRLPSTPSR